MVACNGGAGLDVCSVVRSLGRRGQQVHAMDAAAIVAGWRHAPANCLHASGSTHQQAGSHQRCMHYHLCTPRHCMQHMRHPRGSIVPAGHYLDTFRFVRAAGFCPKQASAARSSCMHASMNARSAAVAVRRVNAGPGRGWPPLVSDERRVLRCGS